MEFIQWKTGDLYPGKGRDEIVAYHGMFRLDALDVELMDKDLLFELRNEQAKDAAENGTKLSRSYPQIVVTKESLEEYKKECVKTFIKLMGLNE
jgi:hypothetical protein